MDEAVVRAHPQPWNKGKLVGQKAPFKLKEIWAIRVRLQLFRRARDLALFDLGIDSKLRACDLVRLKVATSATATASPRGPSSCNKRPLDRCSSRSPSPRGRPWPLGSRRQVCARKTTSSQAASMNRVLEALCAALAPYIFKRGLPRRGSVRMCSVMPSRDLCKMAPICDRAGMARARRYFNDANLYPCAR